MPGRSPPGDCGKASITPLHHFTYAARCVFRRNSLQFWMRLEKPLALRESHGMRRHSADILKSRSRATHQVVLNGQNCLAAYFERAFKQQVIDTNHGTCERVLNRY